MSTSQRRLRHTPRLSWVLSTLLFVALALSANAGEHEKKHGHEHGSERFHAFHLELGGGSSDDGEDLVDWDFNGWIGNDEHKLQIKSEGERSQSEDETEEVELWLLYSRNVAEFWDLQVGIRYDTQPDPLTYGVIGFAGVAPYFIDTDAYLFVNEHGVSVRIHQTKEFALSQRILLAPYLEADLYAQDVPEQDIGGGLASGEFGCKVVYKLTRWLAPYADVRYERLFGETAAIAQREGEDREAFVATLGVELLL